MNAYDIILPKDVYRLAQIHIMIIKKLDGIWAEYTEFCMGLNYLPNTTLIFPILFSELDFYETLLGRVRAHLPEEILRELHYEEQL